MPKYTKKDRDGLTELCASNLRTVLRYRSMSVAELAKLIDVSARTIEAYTAGRVSLQDAKAGTVLMIADALKVDPYILVGEKPVDSFLKKEHAKEERRKEKYDKQRSTFTPDLVVVDKDGTPLCVEIKTNHNK